MASKNVVLRRSAFKSNKLSSKFKSKPPVHCSASYGGGGGCNHADVVGRVRVAVRLRPKNAEESVEDAADCVELQPAFKRLKVRKNNWDSDTYVFDEVFPEFASQKRVYDAVAKPIVESVLDGYNGTVLAYGQIGTGKTFTLGQLGENDVSNRGIMVRSVEDILSDIYLETDSVFISYIQLYMETIQDLLNPANDNISIAEDPRTGEVSLPGATVVEIRDQHGFLELLRLGEAHRFAANTKLNTESSRSHAILMVQVKRCIRGGEPSFDEDENHSQSVKNCDPPIVRKGKLVVVDLAGSERVHKSGSEGNTFEEAKAINLSLTALGKCINALTENSPHVPIRDSKLTRLLRDSFGGSARTSLVVTIGPSPRHRGETTSSILFGQRAMQVENMLKIKEEFDYKSLSKRLEVQMDKLIADGERRQKAFDDEIKRISLEAQNHISDELEKERTKCQMDYLESIKKLEEKWIMNQQKQQKNGFSSGTCDRVESNVLLSEEVAEANKRLENETRLRKAAEEEVKNLRSQLSQLTSLEGGGTAEVVRLRQLLEVEASEKKKLQDEITSLQSQLLQLPFESDQMWRYIDKLESENGFSRSHSLTSPSRTSQQKDRGSGHKSPLNSIFEQGWGIGDKVEALRLDFGGGSGDQCREVALNQGIQKGQSIIGRKHGAAKTKLPRGAKISQAEDGLERPSNMANNVSNHKTNEVQEKTNVVSDSPSDAFVAARDFPRTTGNDDNVPSHSMEKGQEVFQSCHNLNNVSAIEKQTRPILCSSPEVTRVREALKSSARDLRASVTDLLPVALKIAETLCSAGVVRTNPDISGEKQTRAPVVGPMQKNIVTSPIVIRSAVRKSSLEASGAGVDVSSKVATNCTRNDGVLTNQIQPPKEHSETKNLELAKKGNLIGHDYQDHEIHDSSRFLENLRKKDGLVGDIQGQPSCKRSLMEPNGTGHTFLWDDSIDEMSGIEPATLPSSSKRNKITPLQPYIDKKLRRETKKWTPQEEETLREAVKMFGRRWKFIVDCCHEAFSDRTDVDLKDKWRNMSRYSTLHV